jgi:hypothetical protein
MLVTTVVCTSGVHLDLGMELYRYDNVTLSPLLLPIHMTIRIFKEWLVKYFFVHKIVFKAILVF